MEKFTIGTDKRICFKDITKNLVKVMKGEEEISNYIEYVEDRNYNDKRYYIEFDKLLKMGWKQEILLEEGLKKTQIITYSIYCFYVKNLL